MPSNGRGPPMEAGLGSAGLHRVPITAPLGSQEPAEQEYDGEDDQAGGGQRYTQNGQGIRHSQRLRRQVTEELANFVLHTWPFRNVGATTKNNS